MVIRNQKTEDMLRMWLQMPSLPNLLLSGKKGSGKFATVCEILAEIYGTEQPYLLPYVHLIQPTEKGIITKEQVEGILEQASFFSPDRKVFVVDDADTMSQGAQNSLLKVLEDQENSCLFILVAHAPLIPTITSRCMQVPFGTLSMEQAKEFLSNVDPVIWAGADETIGGYLRLRASDQYLKKACELKTAVFHGTREDVLRCCNLLKEKDSNILTESLSSYELRSVFFYLKSEFVRTLFEEDPSRTIRLDVDYVTNVLAKLDQAVKSLQVKQFHAAELFELMLFICSRKDK